QILNPEGLKPIYLKGTAHLLSGLYPDIAERMLSDIDFLLEENDARKAWELLKKSSYFQQIKFGESNFEGFRHLPALIKDDEVASVEIHTRLFDDLLNEKLNFSHLNSESYSLPTQNAFAPSVKHQILHNILNAQNNDQAAKEPKVLLRNYYDLLLLSQMEDSLKVVKESGMDFDLMNNYIALAADILDYPPSVTFEKTSAGTKYVEKARWIWEHPKKANKKGKISFLRIRLYRYVSQFLLLFIDARVRKRIFKSLGNKDYRKAHWAMYKKWFS
ncbi:MAG: nucleotidyltransferase family protein, partial [Bacteroidales bacterium]|nr:nucleotidyltransferase family protein [Bacteroidales bacterium]